MHGIFSSDERGPVRSEREVVQIGGEAVAGVDGGDLVIRGVVDDVDTRADPRAERALPPGENRLPTVGLQPEVARHVGTPRYGLFNHTGTPYESRISTPFWTGPYHGVTKM